MLERDQRNLGSTDEDRKSEPSRERERENKGGQLNSKMEIEEEASKGKPSDRETGTMSLRIEVAEEEGVLYLIEHAGVCSTPSFLPVSSL